jgi:signal transduction histidine kinase
LRLLLAASSLLAIWLDPAEPPQFARATYALQWVFLGYDALVAMAVWRRGAGPRLVLAMHTIDIATFAVVQYLTLGPSSPFFIYFIFSMFCGTLRWGWRGALVTSTVVSSAYLLIAAMISSTLDPNDFELNRFIVRVVYLVMAGGMLVYLGQHEARLRDEIERLARWPTLVGVAPRRAIEQILEHASRIVGASGAAMAWEQGDEPTTNVAVWKPGHLDVSERAPMPSLEATLSADARAIVDAPDSATATFHTDRVTGRVYFAGIGPPSVEATPLTAVVAREIGASLDQVYNAHQLQEIAAREERLRLARDLHDGVLQSLTAVRFELLAVGQAVRAGDTSASDRLQALERALSIEQRELRLFIDGLKPEVRPAHVTLPERLAALRERLVLEWKVPVHMHVTPAALPEASHLTDAIPLMVHEAVTNALKHAQPTAVTVTIDAGDGGLRIVVADNGRGFGFKGRYDHGALAAAAVAPRSLFERVSALGGTMSIESSDAGSRVEMVLSA